MLFCMVLLMSGCAEHPAQKQTEKIPETSAVFTRQTKIEDVKRDPAFGNYGRLLFPLDRSYYSGDTLEDLQLLYYSHIRKRSAFF